MYPVATRPLTELEGQTNGLLRGHSPFDALVTPTALATTTTKTTSRPWLGLNNEQSRQNGNSVNNAFSLDSLSSIYVPIYDYRYHYLWKTSIPKVPLQHQPPSCSSVMCLSEVCLLYCSRIQEEWSPLKGEPPVLVFSSFCVRDRPWSYRECPRRPWACGSQGRNKW